MFDLVTCKVSSWQHFGQMVNKFRYKLNNNYKNNALDYQVVRQIYTITILWLFFWRELS